MSFFKRREVPGKELIEKISEAREQTTLEIAQGGNHLILDRYVAREQMLTSESSQKSFPIVTAPVVFDVRKPLPVGRHRIYLASDKGPTVELKRHDQKAETEEAAKLGITLAPVELVEGVSLWSVRTHPELVKKVIDSNLLSNALGLLANRASLILGLVVGFLVGAFVIAFVGLVLVIAGFI
ncbi:MAG: hypothetical protein A4E28_00004 [Methanocella sp. PtaU1.Bin125]|nr:MAG: hypothetical protein A4E28_00004 [Methanocella sp. PtaU1.Bin125]